MQYKLMKTELKTIGNILVGCILYAIAVDWLFEPNQIVVGGFTGIAQILHNFIPVLPIGMTVIVMNIPLFLLGIRQQGLRLLSKSLSTMALSSFLVDILNKLFVFHPMENMLLASIYSGVLMGVALGLALSVGATTGGSDLAARLIKYKIRHISMGKACLTIDFFVVIIYAATFRDINCVLYGLVSMYITSIVMDAVIYGGLQAKMAYIISDNNEQIKEKLLAMNLGVTMLDGSGGWSGHAKDVILCAFRRNEIAMVKDAVMNLDPDAFLIVCDVHEVLGEGFSTYSEHSL